MPRTRRRAAGTVAAVAATLVSSSMFDPGTAAAAPPDRPFCALTGMTTYAWDGGGDGSSWSDPLDWSGAVTLRAVLRHLIPRC